MQTNYFKYLASCILFGVFILNEVIAINPSTSTVATESLIEKLRKLPEVSSVEPIKPYPFFSDAYVILIDQYIDHGNPQAGKFKQRVILSNYNIYSPVILVTEGYRADYALDPSYINELSKIVEANQIVVEHRYFGKSMPANTNWDYLTVKNASDDLHRIVKIFKRIYNNQNKWISTGISKGGQTTLAFKAYYPNDVDIWIPYVAPLNRAYHDTRPEKFLEKVGSDSCRNKIIQFQTTILKRRNEIQPLLDSVITARNYTFPIPNEEVLDYCVLEYSFAFWQWGYSCNLIPADTSSAQVLFRNLIKTSTPEYFSYQGIEPIKAFFIQASRELGYYNYNIKPFEPYLKIKNTSSYIKDIFMPKGVSYKFNSKTMSFVNKALQKDSKHVMLLYGEYDPWSASALVLNKKSQGMKIIQPKGNHQTRVNTLPLSIRKNIYITIENWLNE